MIHFDPFMLICLPNPVLSDQSDQIALGFPKKQVDRYQKSGTN